LNFVKDYTCVTHLPYPFRLLRTVTLSLGRAVYVIDIIELLFLTPGIRTLLFLILFAFLSLRMIRSRVETSDLLK